MRGAAATACAAAVSATALAASMPECEVGASEWASALCGGADVKPLLTDREIAAGAEFNAATSTVHVVFTEPVDVSSVRIVTLGDSEANRFVVSSKCIGQQAFSNCVPRTYAVADHVTHSIDIVTKDVAELQIGIAPSATLPVLAELQVFRNEGSDASSDAVVQRIRDIALKQGIARLYAEAGLAMRVAAASDGAVTAENGPMVTIDEQTGFFATAKNAAAVRDVFKFRKFAMREIAVGDAGVVFVPESNQPHPLARETGIAAVAGTFLATMPEKWIKEEINRNGNQPATCLALRKRKPTSAAALWALIAAVGANGGIAAYSPRRLMDDATEPAIKSGGNLGGGLMLEGVSVISRDGGISPSGVIRLRYFFASTDECASTTVESVISGQGIDVHDKFSTDAKSIDNLPRDHSSHSRHWMVERRIAIPSTATSGICKMEIVGETNGEKSGKVVIDPVFIVQ